MEEHHNVMVDLSILKGGDSSFATGFDLRVHRSAEVFLFLLNIETPQWGISTERMLQCR
jgi:hypothetical protein